MPFRWLGKSITSEYFLLSMVGVIYFYTGATSVTGEDSGSFHLAITTLGVNHPPGYPLYTILGFVFSKGLSLFINETHAINLFSAFWTILALAVFNNTLKKLDFSKYTRTLTILVTAFCTGLWSQTNVAEVYSMNVFFCALILNIYLSLYDSIQRDTSKSKHFISQTTYRYSYAFSLVCGLGIAHHYPLFLLTSAPLILHLWFSCSNDFLYRYLINKKFLLNFLFLIVGLSPYLYLFYPLVVDESPYVFGNLYSAVDVWNHIKRESYSAVDFQTTTFSDKIAYQGYMFELLWVNFKGFILLLPIGIYSCLKSNLKKNLVYILSSFGTTFLLAGILSFPSEPLYFAVFRVYPLPGLMIMAFFIAYGIKFLLFEQTVVNKKIVMASLFFVFSHQFVSNHSLSSRNGYFANLNGARAYLESLPKNSRLLISGDEGISLYFVNQHLKVRQDLTLIAYENSYTREKILLGKEYRAAKKDPKLANQLRAKKILEWAMSERPLVSMTKLAFNTIGVPSRELIYGFAADRKGFNFDPPNDFPTKFVNTSFIKTLFPLTPAPDHWSDANTLNYAPTLIALLAKLGKNVPDFLSDFKKSHIGQKRMDLFETRNFELEKRIVFKLFSLNELEQALEILTRIKKKSSYNDLRFETKYLYCNMLARLNRINQEASFCKMVLFEQQKRHNANKQLK